MKYPSRNNEEIKDLINEASFESEIFRNFLTYWSVRKSSSLDSASHVNEIKSSNPELWLTLISSNHKFRSLYGEETAQRLIRTISNKFE